MAKVKNVAIWIRVSTAMQVESESPEVHLQRAKSYCEFKGWNIVKTFRLDGLSGKSIKEYPETIEMMDDVKNGVIDGLVFSKLARLCRNTKELIEIAEHFQEHNADLVSLGENIDTSNPIGRMFFRLISSLAEWERDEISARVKASVSVRAKQGKSLGGAAPYGFKWNAEKELEIVEEQAVVYRLMYDLFLTLRARATVAKQLNELGHRTAKGSNWTDTSVTRALINSASKGLRRINYTQSKGAGKAWEVKPEEDWEFATVPAIVETEKWDAVNDILKVQMQKNKRPGGKVRHLFAGYVFCNCGPKMYVPSNMKKYVCRDCRHKIETEILENLLVSKLKEETNNLEMITNAQKAARKEVKKAKKLLKISENGKISVKNKLDKLFDLHTSGELPTQGFKARYDPLQIQLDQLTQEMPDLQSKIDFLTIESETMEQTFIDATSMADHWSNMSFQQKRTFVETYISKMIVHQRNVEFRWYLSSLTEAKPSVKTAAKPQRNDMDSYWPPA